MAIEYLKTGKPELERSTDDEGVRKTVSAALLDIEERGDTAVREMSAKFDGFEPDTFRLSEAEIERLVSTLSGQELHDIRFAQDQVRSFARAQRGSMQDIEIEPCPASSLVTRTSRSSPRAATCRAASSRSWPRHICRWQRPMSPAFRVSSRQRHR